MWDASRALSLVHAPRILLQMVTLLYMANGFMERDINMAEYFAGQMEVTCPIKKCVCVFLLFLVFSCSSDFPLASYCTICCIYIYIYLVVAEVTKCWARCGYKVAPFEINLLGEMMDILTPQGFL